MKKYIAALLTVSVLLLTASPLAAATSASDDLTAVCTDNPTSSLCKGYNKGENATPEDNAVLKLIKRIINIL